MLVATMPSSISGVGSSTDVSGSAGGRDASGSAITGSSGGRVFAGSSGSGIVHCLSAKYLGCQGGMHAVYSIATDSAQSRALLSSLFAWAL